MGSMWLLDTIAYHDYCTVPKLLFGELLESNPASKYKVTLHGNISCMLMRQVMLKASPRLADFLRGHYDLLC
jgi:hypothetical protein